MPPRPAGEPGRPAADVHRRRHRGHVPNEDIAFAERLMQAGVPTELHVNPVPTTRRRYSRRSPPIHGSGLAASRPCAAAWPGSRPRLTGQRPGRRSCGRGDRHLRSSCSAVRAPRCSRRSTSHQRLFFQSADSRRRPVAHEVHVVAPVPVPLAGHDRAEFGATAEVAAEHSPALAGQHLVALPHSG